MIYNKILSKIYLNCRRGMLELDLILLTFVETKYINLNDKLKKKFINLLDESDNTIYSLIIKKNHNKKYTKIIKEIININKNNKFN